jgi:DNA-binding transcriptional LysR family regulator
VVPLVYEMHPDAMRRHLAEGLLDIGFTIGKVAEDHVRAEVLGTSTACVVCGPSHPLHRKGRIRADDLGRHPFVVPRFFQREYLPSLDQFPEQTHPRRVGATIELLQMMIELVLGGAYLGCFPRISIEHRLGPGGLRVLDGLRGLPRFELLALTRKGVAPKRSAVLLVQHLQRVLRLRGRHGADADGGSSS